MSAKYDYIIIGAGIVGLATAYKLINLRPNSKICILEKESEVGMHQTGRNSGVVHSGAYYRPGSLKAKNCINGRIELIRFCEQFQVPHKRVGKVIVATSKKELPLLESLAKRAKENLIASSEIICSEKLHEIEPNVRGIQALWLPDVFILNYQDVAKNLSKELIRLGSDIFFNSKATNISYINNSVVIETSNKKYHGKFLINCCGLHSDIIAQKSEGKNSVQNQIIPFRGEYYKLSEERQDLIKGLVYPIPNPDLPFLGVHLSRTIDGNIEAGPNAVLALSREGYKKLEVNPKDVLRYLSYKGFWNMAVSHWKSGVYEIFRSIVKDAFVKDVQKLVPSILSKDLIRSDSGVRAQLVDKNGKLIDDFSLNFNKNSIHVLNAPSPAATACFSIGEEIARKALISI